MLTASLLVCGAIRMTWLCDTISESGDWKPELPLLVLRAAAAKALPPPLPSRWSITREPPREAAGHPSPLAECRVVFMLIAVRLCLFTCSDLHSRPISRSSVHVGWSRNQFPLLTSYIVKFWIRVVGIGRGGMTAAVVGLGAWPRERQRREV
ncbi:hypothetical protein DY000_02053782 [Brassica cretica]|uniref:Secreted protein n=1 Tax=Brassica cretica TaxID=69181 RepID=A0ABQ7AB80_BRACR|nr:hypothetical protein DY000_02053782 [Brassica cretica]